MYRLRPRSWFVAALAGVVLSVGCGQDSASYSPTAPTGLSDIATLASADESGVSTTASVSDDSATLLKGGNSGNKGKGGDDGADNDADKSKSGHEDKVSGFVTAVGTDTIVVRGVTVKLTTDTIIRHGNRTLAIGDIHVGNHAQARGTLDGTTLVASEVKVEPNGNHDGDDDDDDNDDDEDEDDDAKLRQKSG